MTKKFLSICLAMVMMAGIMQSGTISVFMTAQAAGERFVLIEAQARISLSEQPISYDRMDGRFTVRVGSSVIMDVPHVGGQEMLHLSRSDANFQSRTNNVSIPASHGSEATFSFDAPGNYVVATLVGGMDFFITVVADAPPPQPDPAPPAPPTVPEGTTATILNLRLQIDSTAYHLNGEARQMEAAPFIADGRTMVPVALISQALGATVTWNPDTSTVTIVQDATVLQLTIGQPLPNNMGTPVIRNGRTFVPVAYISDMLGANVRWDGSAGAVYITQ